MIEIKIEYSKRTFTFWHPEKFNELNEEQYRAFIEHAYLPRTPLDERMSDRLILMQEFLGKKMNYAFKTRWYKVIDSMVNEGVIDELLKLQDFMQEEQIFNNWILKELRIKKNSFYGPYDRFGYMTFAEFISADMLFMAWFDTKDDNVLVKFAATLYKDEKDQEFSSKLIAKRTEAFTSLDEIDLSAIVFNYSSMRYWLTQKYPFVFKGSGDSQELHLGSSQHSWMNIRRNLAGDVLNLDKVDKLHLHDVLADLNEKMSK